jgi:hypothetical protein
MSKFFERINRRYTAKVKSDGARAVTEPLCSLGRSHGFMMH